MARIVRKLLIESRRNRRLTDGRLQIVVKRRRSGAQVEPYAVLFLTASRKMKAQRTCRRLQRNQGFRNIVWKMILRGKKGNTTNLRICRRHVVSRLIHAEIQL